MSRVYKYLLPGELLKYMRVLSDTFENHLPEPEKSCPSIKIFNKLFLILIINYIQPLL